MYLNLEEINTLIKEQICYETIDKLTDINLLQAYIESNSVKKNIKYLETILKKFINNNETINDIINEYLFKLIPPGTKSIIRGLKFNEIVRKHILNIELINTPEFEIFFEKKCSDIHSDEIPDFYIKNKINNKILIGMNQMDFSSGGHQTNRGMKYISLKFNTDNIKLICVICNDIKIVSVKSKIYNIYNTGFINKSLCYLKGLNEIILNHFFNTKC